MGYMKFGKILLLAVFLAAFLALPALIFEQDTRPPLKDSAPGPSALLSDISADPAFSPDKAAEKNDPGAALALGREIVAGADAVRASIRAGRERGIICGDGVFQGVVEKGETVGEILERSVKGGARPYVEAMARVFSLRAFREGQPYVILTDPDSGRMRRFEYEINDLRRLVVEGMDKPAARLEDIEYETSLERAEGVIDENLFQAVADIGENPQLALRLVNLFGSEINFIRDIQEGDSFAVLIEKRHRNGDYRGYGRILAARFTCRGETFEAFLHHDDSGRPNYYNAKGENLKKTLLQAPLSVTRLTSSFSHSRKHPILGLRRPHLGVDYGAPTGTPVKAVGEGVVTEKGWNGGYGNQIIIKHEAGLESMYAHLSGFARGLREGQKVRQGQVIGFVGSTGLSTGPHLDFRLRQKGRFIDPTKAINPRAAPVSPKNRKNFERVMALEKACLEGRKTIGNYTLDSIAPPAVTLIPQKAPALAKPEKSAAGRKAPESRKRPGARKKTRRSKS